MVEARSNRLVLVIKELAETTKMRNQSVVRQKGAIIITLALTLLFLLGFMGIALDFGRFFVVKSELQTAVDSCALAAAKELDGAPDSLTRGVSAGLTVANMNNYNFQGASAGFVGNNTINDIEFSNALNGSYSRDFTPVANAKYARCTTRTPPPLDSWLLKSLGAFLQNTSLSGTWTVAAVGVATLAPSQSSCMLPIGICAPPVSSPYTIGQWIEGAVGSSGAVSGQFHWLDFTGNAGGANDVTALLRGEGNCALPNLDTTVRESGNMGGAVAQAYNSRFGVYTGSNAPPAGGIPDLTGYAYYSDISPTTMSDKFGDFVSKRTTHTPYQGDNKSGKGPGTADNLGLDGVVPPGNIYSALSTAGANRRLVTVPIVTCPIPNSSSAPVPISGIACVLLLHPIKGGASGVKMWVEYRGDATVPGSPCSTAGLPGGSTGPLVPVLAR